MSRAGDLPRRRRDVLGHGPRGRSDMPCAGRRQGRRDEEGERSGHAPTMPGAPCANIKILSRTAESGLDIS